METFVTRLKNECSYLDEKLLNSDKYGKLSIYIQISMILIGSVMFYFIKKEYVISIFILISKFVFVLFEQLSLFNINKSLISCDIYFDCYSENVFTGKNISRYVVLLLKGLFFHFNINYYKIGVDVTNNLIVKDTECKLLYYNYIKETFTFDLAEVFFSFLYESYLEIILMILLTFSQSIFSKIQNLNSITGIKSFFMSLLSIIVVCIILFIIFLFRNAVKYLFLKLF